jgi:uncharacterized protein YdeI (YjbR/CyaY-like superfamily)
MSQRDRRIDAYIENAKPFAKPILKHLRELVHQTCPEVKESIKWSSPHFEYKGMFCGMASFKGHCAFGFWKGSLMKDPHKIMSKDKGGGMGQFGQLTSLEDLPSDEILCEYIREAMKLNEEGVKVLKPKAKEKMELEIPDYFWAALRKKPAALRTFEEFSYSKQKDYVEWVTEAKQEATREKRLATAIEWLSEGKSRNWKYESC